MAKIIVRAYSLKHFGRQFAMMAQNSSRRNESLVSTEWLEQKLAAGADNLRIVHASWPTCTDSKTGHIPWAVCFEGEHCRDHNSPYKFMLPTPEEFAEYVGQQLGIDNNTEVIVYDSNDTNPMVIYATRVWYMFRVFGHDRIRLLDGGLKKWKLENRPIAMEKTAVTPKHFTPHFRPELVLSYEQVVEKVTKHKEIQLVDARPPKSFSGEATDPYAEGKSGHIRNAINLPISNILNTETGLIQNDDNLKKSFESAGVDLGAPLAVSCGMGMSATGLAFGAFLLGKNTPVYDGSWFEWVRRAPDEYLDK